MGVHMVKRHDTATEVQNILTEYGCVIKTRIGLHDAADDRSFCSEKGLIILEFIYGADSEAAEMKAKLCALEDVTVKTMEF